MPDTPLTAEVSPDVAEAVGDFMEQAAAQNEAAAEAVPESAKTTSQGRTSRLRKCRSPLATSTCSRA